jgi:hypothetical protein
MELVFAYIDPGSGSLVIQALIAGLVAAPIFFRRQIMRVVHKIRGDETPAEMTPAADDTIKGD